MAVVTGDKVAACSAAAAEPAVSRLGQTRTVPVTLGTPPAT
jgi:hypothetical protein